MVPTVSPSSFPEEAEDGLKVAGTRADIMPQARPSNHENRSMPLSAHQQTLLAGFGVFEPIQSKCSSLTPAGNEKVNRSERQDLPAPSSSQALKEVATTPFHPTFIQPHRNTPSHPRPYAMALGNFDTSKDGAPPRKQKVIDPPIRRKGDAVKTVIDGAHTTNRLAPPIKTLRSESMTPSTLSEASNVAASFQTQSTELSSGARRTDANVQNTNRITIPGFDPSKYGRSNLRTSGMFVNDEAKVNTGTHASPIISDLESRSTSHDPPTSFQHIRQPLSDNFQPQLSCRPLDEESGLLRRPGLSSSDDLPLLNSARIEVNTPANPIHMASVAASGFVPTSRALQAPRMLSSSKAGTHEMARKRPLASEPRLSDIERETRLKQVQEAGMREITAKKKMKSTRETLPLRDLQPARTATALDFLPPAPPSFQPIHEEESARDGSINVKSQTPQFDRSRNAPKTFPSALPLRPSGVSRVEYLQQVQQASLKDIKVGIRTNDGLPETTSLRDLQLARTPAAADVSTLGANTVKQLQEPSSTASQGSKGKKDSGQAIADTAEENATAVFALDIVTEKKSRNPKWCTNEELRPIQANLETDSNAWGSNVPSNASVATIDSTRPMQLHGKLFKGPPANERDEVEALVGWDGKMQPPPVDWNDRPRFNNNSPAFKAGFNNWFATAALDNCEMFDKTGIFRRIPYHQVSNVEWHADGIGMVRREFSLNVNNVSKYGYDIDPADLAKHAEPINPQDFSDWGKLDMREPDNVTFKDETTKKLVNNWLAHQQHSKKETTLAVIHGYKTAKESKAFQPEANPNKPAVNIYLRPAVKTDVRQLTALYNWWVENGVRPAETRGIELSDMRERLDQAKSDSLPFIVAISKAKKDVPRDQATGVKGELIVGFACATGFTALDYVEHIAAELEIYVHNEYLQVGVGRCLLDRLMCATDRGYMERGGYSFHCDPSERHWYEVGGARNLHKLAFVVRHHSRPKKDIPEEADAMSWLKKWLAKDWDFEQEACLKQNGAKNGRFLDVTYFSKFSKWLPEEGRVPDPEPKDHKHAPPLG